MKLGLKNEIVPMLFVGPSIILLVAIILIPTVQVLALSFTNATPGGVADFAGLKNYVDLLLDSSFLAVTLNNFVFVVVVVGLELTVGLSAALVLNQRFPLQGVWVALLLSPFAISPVVGVVIWRFILDPSYGIMNYALSRIGIEPIVWFSNRVTSFIPIILVSVWKFFPFMMIISYAALTSIPTDVIEAAKIDGVSGIRSFRLITLPLILPALLVGVVFRTIFVLRQFEIVWVFTGGGPGNMTEILSISIYKQGFMFFNFGRAAAVSWILLVITFALSVPLIRATYNRTLNRG